jgi:hypothetical protein
VIRRSALGLLATSSQHLGRIVRCCAWRFPYHAPTVAIFDIHLLDGSEIGGKMADFDGVCEIRRAGVSPEGLAQLDLKAVDGSFDWNFFLSSDNLGREMLATALAAICSNKRVHAQIADPVTSWSRVHRLLLVA